MTAIAKFLGAGMRHASRRALQFDEKPAGLPAPVPGHRYLLYLHVPFCESLCPFCSFHRVQFRSAKAKPYFEALRAEIDHYAALGFEFGEVYVGGGTPTVLPEELARTLGWLREHFAVTDISVETNPNHLTPPVIQALQAAGITRLSVGVQSFDDELLKRMGRYQAYGSGLEIAERLARVQTAFPTVNADLIFNLPGQSADSFARDLEILAQEVGVAQASFYPLMVTPSTRARMRAEMGETQADSEQALYRMIESGLGQAYQASSAWCFSRGAAQVDEYVIAHEDYVGAGSGAFGYLQGQLQANTFSLRDYQARVASGQTGVTHSREFSRREQLRYHLLMRLFGLHLDKGLTIDRFGAAAWRRLAPEVAALKLAGAVREQDAVLRLTPRGRYYWVVMMREFFSGVNRFREVMREQWRSGGPMRTPLTRKGRDL
ncbi:MAG: coproporphyrinogen III oxidase family protein [Gammaproteobacteria bacterium]